MVAAGEDKAGGGGEGERESGEADKLDMSTFVSMRE
jgi:hypothetical protein